MANQDYAIAVKNLSFFYQQQQVLKNITTKFRAHGITAIIGPSGSGKSTLLRCFNKIYALHLKQRTEGEIIINYDALGFTELNTDIQAEASNKEAELKGQHDILHEDMDINQLRKDVGMVFQKPTPFPMSIYDNLEFPIKLHQKLPNDQIKDKIKELLKKVWLWSEVKEKLNRSAYALSGGQQQRLCMARTLATEPKILLLDEPTSSLDPTSTNKIEALIAELKTQYTIVMVTHNLNQAKRIADETIFMKQGEIIEQGPTAELFNNPQRLETKEYIEHA